MHVLKSSNIPYEFANENGHLGQSLNPDQPKHILNKLFVHFSKLNIVTLDPGPLTLGVESRPQSQHMLKHYRMNSKITVQKNPEKLLVLRLHFVHLQL